MLTPFAGPCAVKQTVLLGYSFLNSSSQEQNIALSWGEFQRIFNFLVCIFLLVTSQKYWSKKLQPMISQSTPKIIHKGQPWFVAYS